MSQADKTFSLVSRLIALLDHPLIKRRNLAFTLNQPFSWALINAADVLARMPTDDIDEERADQLKIKMATLRHFNRMVSCENSITMKQIHSCLALDSEIPTEQIKLAARDRVAMERRSGKLGSAGVKARFTHLYTTMYEAAATKHRQQKMVANDVYFLCNRSSESLSAVPDHLDTKSIANIRTIDSGYDFKDEDLADYDQYGYMIDALLDRCTNPCINGLQEAQMVLDKSYRNDGIQAASALSLELTKIGQELGISWDKLKHENARIDAELKDAMADDAKIDAEIDADIDSIDMSSLVEPELPEMKTRTLIKSPERLAREADDAKANALKLAYEEAAKVKAGKAATTRALNKAAKSATTAL